MKFRAKLTYSVILRQFAQLVHTLSKCSKQLIFRVVEDKLILNIHEAASTNDGISSLCEIPNTVFCEYNMEGVSPEFNEIYLEVQTDSLALALSNTKSSHNVMSLKMKLTKKHVPCLTFEIENRGPIHSISGMICTHDVPVSVIGRKNWNLYREPDLPSFDISLQIPDIRLLRKNLDRLKNLGKKLTICAEKNEHSGELTFSIHGSSVKATVYFPELRVYELERDHDETRNGEVPKNTFTVGVDPKSALLAVPVEVINPTNFICSIVEGDMLHLYFLFGDISLQFCVPGRID